MGNFSVRAKRTSRRSPATSVSETTRVLETAACSFFTVMVMSNGVLKRGSSKPGNAWRAEVGSNCEKT